MNVSDHENPFLHLIRDNPYGLRVALLMALSRHPQLLSGNITEEDIKTAVGILARELGLKEEQQRPRNPLDTVAEFVEEECMVGRQYRVPTQDLYNHYLAWCVRNHKPPVNRSHFGRELRKLVPGLKRVRPWGDGKDRPVFYVGIGLKQDQGRLRRKNVNSEKVSGWRRLRVDTMPAARTEKA